MYAALTNHTNTYENGFLPCWQLRPAGKERGVLLFHGGNDSLLEEFLHCLLYLSEAGWRVLAFEGLSQGEALREYGLTFTPQWERPVRAVLDFFQVNEAALIGVSLGGELALRAAAFEPRNRKVVSWCALSDFYDGIMENKPAAVRSQMEKLLESGQDETLLDLCGKMAERSPLIRWSMNRSCFAYGTADLCRYIRFAKEFSLEPIAGQITQDVLLLAAREDLMVSLAQCTKAAGLLTNARSLALEILDRAQHVQAHCSVGNTGLVLRRILTRLEREE